MVDWLMGGEYDSAALYCELHRSNGINNFKYLFPHPK